jgi:hypothetical protein
MPTADATTVRTFRLPDAVWEALAAIARRDGLYSRTGDDTSGLNRTAALIAAVESHALEPTTRTRKERAR